MLEMILNPIRNYRIRRWLTSVETFAKKMKKAKSYFIIADEKQKEALEMAKMILKHSEKAKQGNKASMAIVKVCLEESGKEGKELLAKMP